MARRATVNQDHHAVFDGNVSNKNCTISASDPWINDIVIRNGYSGIITITSGHTLKVGTGALSQTSVMNGGTITGAGTLEFDGPGIEWQAGTMSGTGLIFNKFGSLFEIKGNGTKLLEDRTFQNEGTLQWDSGAGDWTLDKAAVLKNQNGGIFDIKTDAKMIDGGNGATRPIIVNESITPINLFVKSAGSGTTEIQVAFTNKSDFQINSGTVSFTKTASQTAGTTTIANGKTLKMTTQNYVVSGGTLYTGAAATIDGSLEVTGGSIKIGDIALTPGIGQLVITGNYIQSGGTLFIDTNISGTRDQIWIDPNGSGTATLGGTLATTATGPQGTGQFNIIIASGLTGDFGTKSLRSPFPHFTTWKNGGTYQLFGTGV